MQPYHATSVIARPAGQPPASPGPEAALRAALLDSRQRWQGFVALGCDWVFETDAAGRFTFVWPEGALGWPDACLVGQSAASLLALPEGEGFDPFAAVQPIRGQPAWVRTRGGETVLLRFSVAPLDGKAGVRGVAVDMTADQRHAEADAAALRRAELVEHVLVTMREEVLAPRMLDAALRGAAIAAGADGAAVLEAAPPGREAPALRRSTRPVPPAVVARAGHVLRWPGQLGRGGTEPAGAEANVLASPIDGRIGAAAVLVFWRDSPDHGWSGDDHALAAALAGVIRTVIEQDDVQHELSRQARTDPLTGLLNRRAFAEELERRIGRAQNSAGAGGVLMAVDLDGFKPVNDRYGHEAGDTVLVAVAGLLRRTFRPTDLLARLGGDEFAVWLDGADELTAAERADALCGALPDTAAQALAVEAGAVTMSVGIAPVDPLDTGLEGLMHRADAAMFAAKSAGGNLWQVDHGSQFPVGPLDAGHGG